MGRRALVTGAARGLAAGIAPVLARSGFSHVAITYRHSAPDATLEAVRAAGANASASRVDFRDAAETIESDLVALVREFGPFDTLVHAVGPIVVKRFERLTLDDYRDMFDGNVRSAVLAARAVLPAMRDAGFGRIVAFGAIGAQNTQPFPGFSFYQAAKSATIAFARCLALEEARHGITVNVVVPGDIREKAIERATARERAAPNPRGQQGSFEDIADAVCFLVAADRDFVTGAVLEVTGGLTVADARTQAPQ
jgi:3-oxoacyl-[acyl-carrier protein] reductase